MSEPEDQSRPDETRREAGAPPGADGTRHEAGKREAVGTRREGQGRGGYVRVRLPSDLDSRFEILEPLRPGAEADIFVVRRRDESDDRLRVLKLYRENITLDGGALAQIQQLPHEHVVEIAAYGESEAGWWEEQEYLELGSLAALLVREGPELGRGRLDAVIDELRRALEAVHPIFHRDVKPANILVRDLDPLDLVLGDFGMARLADESQIMSTIAGSTAYLSPEGLEGHASTARDWWAVGMVVAEAAGGRHPFYEPGIGWPSEHEMRMAIITRPVPLDQIEDPRVKLLCRGLLVKDPRQRWGADQVRAWQAGASPPVADERVRRPGQIQPFPFAGTRCGTPEALAPLLAARWSDALKLISGAASEAPDYVRLVVWLREHDEAAALRVLEQGVHDRSVARRVFRFLRVLDPVLPPSFRGQVIDRDGLLSLARAAVGGDVDAGALLADLRELGIIAELGREEIHAELIEVDTRWRAQIELLERLRTELGPIGAPLDDDDVLRMAHARILSTLLDESLLDELSAQVAAGDADPALEESDHLGSLYRRVRQAVAP